MGSREGRGGGFMERDEIVEYRKSRDAEKDDEWDEFGRKRRRKERGGVNSNGSDVNDDFRDEKSGLESNKDREELEEEEGDDDDR